jgi:hypothetical protein
MIVEYMKNIALLISIVSAGAFFSPFLMKVPDASLDNTNKEENKAINEKEG